MDAGLPIKVKLKSVFRAGRLVSGTQCVQKYLLATHLN